MLGLRPAGALICAGFLIFTGLSCLPVQTRNAMSVQVMNAETKEPINLAQIRVWHFNDGTSGNGDSSIATDRGGMANVRSISGKSDDLVLEVAAKGYATEEKSVNPASHIVVQLYAEPKPTIELDVPRLYRGLVSVKVQIVDNTPATPGQRLFPFEVPESGVVEIVGPALFRHLSPDYRAKLSDGTVLPLRPEGLDVGFWWLKTSGEYEIFLVGTKADYEAYWRDHPNEQPQERKGGKGHGGKGGHGGGHGHSGGSGDPSGGGSVGGNRPSPDQ